MKQDKTELDVMHFLYEQSYSMELAFRHGKTPITFPGYAETIQAKKQPGFWKRWRQFVNQRRAR